MPCQSSSCAPVSGGNQPIPQQAARSQRQNSASIDSAMRASAGRSHVCLCRCSPSERVQVRAAAQQLTGPRFAFDGQGLLAAFTHHEAVAEMAVNELFRHLVEEQATLTNCTLLIGGQDGHDEPVADVDVELVS